MADHFSIVFFFDNDNGVRAFMYVCLHFFKIHKYISASSVLTITFLFHRFFSFYLEGKLAICFRVSARNSSCAKVLPKFPVCMLGNLYVQPNARGSLPNILI